MRQHGQKRRQHWRTLEGDLPLQAYIVRETWVSGTVWGGSLWGHIPPICFELVSAYRPVAWMVLGLICLYRFLRFLFGFLSRSLFSSIIRRLIVGVHILGGWLVSLARGRVRVEGPSELEEGFLSRKLKILKKRFSRSRELVIFTYNNW